MGGFDGQIFTTIGSILDKFHLSTDEAFRILAEWTNENVPISECNPGEKGIICGVFCWGLADLTLMIQILNGFCWKCIPLKSWKITNGHLGNLKIPENDVLCTHKKTPFDVVGAKKSHVFVLGLDFTGLYFISKLGLQNCMLLSCHVRVSRLINTLELPECEGTSCSKQVQYLKFKWQQRDSNPKSLSS